MPVPKPATEIPEAAGVGAAAASLVFRPRARLLLLGTNAEAAVSAVGAGGGSWLFDPKKSSSLTVPYLVPGAILANIGRPL